jgi:hypothetical protein
MWAKRSEPLAHPDARSAERARAHDPDSSGDRGASSKAASSKAGSSNPKSGAWALTLGSVLVIVWFGGVAAAAVGYVLDGGRLDLPDWEIALGGVGVVTIGGVIWLAALVVREGIRARSAAERLHAAADLLLSPASAAETSMRRLGAVIRHEIATVDRTLAETLARLQAVEQSLSRQSSAISSAANSAESGANALAGRLDGHARTLTDIAAMLKSRAEEITAVSVDQTDRVAQTLTHADVVLRDIETRMSQRVGDFDATLSTMSARSDQFNTVARGVAQKAQMLDNSLGEALHTIATAARLVDMSQDATSKAAEAARVTADAVQRGVGETLERATAALRQLRADSEAADAAGREGLVQLRDAGEAARLAAENARAAADAYAAQVQQRMQDLAQTVFDATARSDRYADARLSQALRELQSSVVVDGPAAGPQGAERASTPVVVAPPRASDAEFRSALDAAAPSLAGSSPAGAGLGVSARQVRAPGDSPSVGPAGRASAWSWRDVLATADAQDGSSADLPANQSPAGHRVAAPQMGRIGAAFDDIGVNPFTAIAGEAMERVLGRLGNGAIARRRAVREVAHETVLRIRSRLLADTPLREAASAFLAERDPLFDALSPETARRAIAEAETAEGRSFLLLDAAMR